MNLFMLILLFGSSSAISNGYRALEYEFPFLVSVQDQWGIHYFDAVIISPTLVLTSCDNVATVTPAKFDVKTAVYNARLVTGSSYLLAAVVTRFPDKIYPHEKCREVNNLIEYDIALIKVTEPYKFDSKVKPAQMSFDTSWLEKLMKKRRKIQVVGWGETKDVKEGQEPNPHQFVIDLKLLDSESCSDYLCEGKSCRVPSTTICTSPLDFGSLCSGDSGSPIYFNKRIWAISTFVSKPCGASQHHIFTRLDSCKPWLFEMIMSKETFSPELYAKASQTQAKLFILIVLLIINS